MYSLTVGIKILTVGIFLLCCCICCCCCCFVFEVSIGGLLILLQFFLVSGVTLRDLVYFLVFLFWFSFFVRIMEN